LPPRTADPHLEEEERAHDLGAEYANRFFVTQPRRRVHISTLEQIARHELRQQNIGTRPERDELVIVPECKDAFVRGVQDACPRLKVLDPPPPALISYSQHEYYTLRLASKLRFPFDRHLAMSEKDAHLLREQIIKTPSEHALAKLKPFPTIAKKARLVFLAGQYNIIIQTFEPKLVHEVKAAVGSSFPIADFSCAPPERLADLRSDVAKLDDKDAIGLTRLLQLSTVSQQFDLIDNVEYHLRIREPRINEIKEIETGQLRFGSGF
jgi:hypothetical protein